MNSQNRAVGIIPVRYESTRLPGKALIDLCGKTMIQRVWEGAREAQLLDALFIATDSERIRHECESFGATVVMPEGAFNSGTDRIAAAAAMLSDSYEIIVNIQGDEPLLKGATVDSLIEALERNPSAQIATPVQRCDDMREFHNPSVVKVVKTAKDRALYFSRAPVPLTRSNDSDNYVQYFKHIGLYAYRRAALQQFVSLPPSPLERIEHLEQLRLLEEGVWYHCLEIQETLVAVDTAEDAEQVRLLLEQASDNGGL